jgi:hypothetical protein
MGSPLSILLRRVDVFQVLVFQQTKIAKLAICFVVYRTQNPQIQFQQCRYFESGRHIEDEHARALDRWMPG